MSILIAVFAYCEAENKMMPSHKARPNDFFKV